MRKIKEVLRLRFGLGLHQDQIARSCSIGQATVHRYLEKAAAAKLSWPLPDDLDDQRLDELLFPLSTTAHARAAAAWFRFRLAASPASDSQTPHAAVLARR